MIQTTIIYLFKLYKCEDLPVFYIFYSVYLLISYILPYIQYVKTSASE